MSLFDEDHPLQAFHDYHSPHLQLSSIPRACLLTQPGIQNITTHFLYILTHTVKSRDRIGTATDVPTTVNNDRFRLVLSTLAKCCQQGTLITWFDVFLTVHHSIDLSKCQLSAHSLNIQQYKLHYTPQHVSSSTLLINKRTNCITTASGIVTLCKQPYSVQ